MEKKSAIIGTEPNLYILEAEIIVDEEKVVDRVSSTFGFRYYKIDKDKGLIINGKSRKMFGVSNHHDYGALGNIDSYDAALKRFLQMQDMGINAVRTTHNSPHKTWLDLSDELGFFIVEELMDGWGVRKGDNKDLADYFYQGIKEDNSIIGGKDGMEWVEFVIKSSIKRDRNHPSVLMWSLGNEIGYDDKSKDYVKNTVMWGREIDDSRIYTLGDNDWQPDRVEVCKSLVSVGGIIGKNYGGMNIIQEGINYFGMIYLSETKSTLNSRGIYSIIANGKDRENNDGKFHLSSYDTSYAGYGDPVYRSVYRVMANDFISGQFPWTGYDYIGEPSPWNGNKGSQSGQSPIPNSAYFGAIDTANFPKDNYYVYRALLNRKSTTVHMVSAWDKNNICFPNGGDKSPVFIYSNAGHTDVYRSDKDSPVCRVRRNTERTDGGFEYYTYMVDSLDDVCEAIEPSEEGTQTITRMNIQFVEGTQLYIKVYDEENNEIDWNNIGGRKIVYAPNRDKLQLSVNVDLVGKQNLKANGKSLAFIEVSIVDDTGMLDTKVENIISFSLEGEGKILGVDNGDQAIVDKYQQESVLKGIDFAIIKAYAGMALAIVSSTRNPGDIKLTVSSDGLEDKIIQIKSE